MIKEVKVFVANCDGKDKQGFPCGREYVWSDTVKWFDTVDLLKDLAGKDGWSFKDGGKAYCEEHTFYEEEENPKP
jgi:hypothetical protein